jgi:hypothetical protein
MSSSTLSTTGTIGGSFFIVITSGTNAWNPTTGQFETQSDGVMDDFDIAMTETVVGVTGKFKVAFPATITSGTYEIDLYEGTASSYTPSGTDEYYWDTVAIYYSGIPTTAQIASALAGRTISVTSPVTENQDIEIVAGDDYVVANGRELTWPNTGGDWCNGDMTDASVVFVAEPINGDGDDTVNLDGRVITATGTQEVGVDLASAYSTLFVKDGSLYKYHLVFTDANGYVETRVIGKINAKQPL